MTGRAGPGRPTASYTSGALPRVVGVGESATPARTSSSPGPGTSR
ncbi:hypothetical protein RMO59_38570 [Streptomyces alfalfae]